MAVNSEQTTSFLLGKLSLDSFPFHEPIVLATFVAVVIGGLAVLAALTYFKV